MKRSLGVRLNARLFERYPEVVLLLKGAKMDSLSKHFVDALELVATSFDDMWNVRAYFVLLFLLFSFLLCSARCFFVSADTIMD